MEQTLHGRNVEFSGLPNIEEHVPNKSHGCNPSVEDLEPNAQIWATTMIDKDGPAGHHHVVSNKEVVVDAMDAYPQLATYLLGPESEQRNTSSIPMVDQDESPSRYHVVQDKEDNAGAVNPYPLLTQVLLGPDCEPQGNMAARPAGIPRHSESPPPARARQC